MGGNVLWIVWNSIRKTSFLCACGVICLLLIGGQPACAQTAGGQPDASELVKRLAAAEARIERLEAEIASKSEAGAAQPASTTAPAAETPAAAAPEAAPEPPAEEESHEHTMSIPGGPALKIRGFFDIDYDDGSVAQNLNYPLGVPAHPSFRAGEFDLFMTSQLAEKLSFLTEMVFSTDQTNNFGVDLERFQLTYRHNKYFEISGGRYHTSIGYYNTAFHHGTWFSTATGRPFMFYFEDSGGPLPVHEVGMTSTGLVPGSGKLNLHWIAEVGNGSAEVGSPLYGDGVENFATDRNHKDVNLAAYIRPEWMEGLQIGGSFLTGDLIPSNGTPRVNQTVSSLYAVLIDSKWEFLNEFVLLHHRVTNGGPAFNSPMGYTQIAYHFGKYRPYFRFQEVNIPTKDPVTTFTGRYEGPSVGLRYDAFTFACLKLQFNRVYLRNATAQNGAELQMAFAF
jgi:hypothetical protein